MASAPGRSLTLRKAGCVSLFYSGSRCCMLQVPFWKAANKLTFGLSKKRCLHSSSTARYNNKKWHLFLLTVPHSFNPVCAGHGCNRCHCEQRACGKRFFWTKLTIFGMSACYSYSAAEKSEELFNCSVLCLMLICLLSKIITKNQTCSEKPEMCAKRMCSNKPKRRCALKLETEIPLTQPCVLCMSLHLLGRFSSSFSLAHSLSAICLC